MKCVICGGTIFEPVLSRLNYARINGRKEPVHGSCNLIRTAALMEIEREKIEKKGAENVGH